MKRELTSAALTGYRFTEEAVFAWVPTLTSVSRQASFAGKPPFLCPGSLFTTDREPNFWKTFWQDQGLSPHEVSYLKGLGSGPLGPVEEVASQPRVRVLGLVVDIVDRIMHGMELGAAGMHGQVRQWVREEYLADLFALLMANGFEVHLTSDHGNIEARGIGKPAEGAIAELRGERARIYSDAALRRRIRGQFPHTLEWPSIGLPEDFQPLLAQGRDAFVVSGQRIVGHGSISLEEVIVPYVQVRAAHD